MYNVGFQAMNNLAMPEEKQPKKEQSMGLLARNVNDTPNTEEEDIRQRVARYTNEIRKARMELKNG
tara:strand:- start:1849 stop:2046 length:198 start_codon:yes stop_codon:yes gene_type:complete